MSVKYPSLVPHVMLSVMLTNTEKSVRDYAHTNTDTRTESQDSLQGRHRFRLTPQGGQRTHSDAENANVDLLLVK